MLVFLRKWRGWSTENTYLIEKMRTQRGDHQRPDNGSQGEQRQADSCQKKVPASLRFDEVSVKHRNIQAKIPDESRETRGKNWILKYVERLVD